MSFNPTPKWTTKIDDSLLKASTLCPCCNKTPGNYDSVVEQIFSHSYYTAQHVPSSLTFTCDNLDCSAFEEDFTVFLKVIIASDL